MKCLRHLVKKFSSLPLHDFKTTIPRSLMLDRPYVQSTLSNGMQVATQTWPSQRATINVIIKCGSRNETLETSGTAHFLQHLHFKGSHKKTRIQLQKGVEELGGKLDAFTSRELTCYTISVFKENLEQGVDIVGDMLSNSLYDSQDVQRQRSTIYAELMQTNCLPHIELLLQFSHKHLYPNHQMGLPILGEISNIQTITRQMIVDYHAHNYSTDNIIVVGTGNIQHERLQKALNKSFASMRKQVKPSTINEEAFKKPQFRGGAILIPDDGDTRVGVMHSGPSFFDEDFYSVLILQRLIGDRPSTLIEQEIMRQYKQFKFQHFLSHYSDILDQKGFYTAYKDAGVYGNYFKVKPHAIDHLPSLVKEGYSRFAQEITDSELERAKRKVYIQLLNHQSQFEIGQSIANYLLYYNRRVTRHEAAERVAAIGPQDIRRAIKKWVLDKEFFMSIWGREKDVMPHLNMK